MFSHTGFQIFVYIFKIFHLGRNLQRQSEDEVQPRGHLPSSGGSGNGDFLKRELPVSTADIWRRHDIQLNDTQHNDTQHIELNCDTKHNDTGRKN